MKNKKIVGKEIKGSVKDSPLKLKLGKVVGKAVKAVAGKVKQAGASGLIGKAVEAAKGKKPAPSTPKSTPKPSAPASTTTEATSPVQMKKSPTKMKKC
jgi:hypothetical protein